MMQAVKSKGTKPEIAVRKIVYSLGYKYRLNVSDLPGRPDLVFRNRKKVIFVHGCFWHRHNCAAGQSKPVTNQDFWLLKLERNKVRDLRNQADLKKLGWKTMIIWECQIKNDSQLPERIKSFLESH